MTARARTTNGSRIAAPLPCTYLIGAGVEKGRLTSRGFGEDQPIASNDTPDGKAENRRVELRILERD